MKILITRPREQSLAFARQVSARGDQPVVFPLLRIEHAAFHVAETGYDWIVCTSTNAVQSVVGKGMVRNARIAAVGPATRYALEEAGLHVDFVPDTHTGQALAETLPGVEGRRILLPHSEIARPDVAVILRRRGAAVDEVLAYRTLPVEVAPEELFRTLRNADAITFFSPSAVETFVATAGGALPSVMQWPFLVACVGPTTAAAARASGLRVDVTAEDHTGQGLIDALHKATEALT